MKTNNKFIRQYARINFSLFQWDISIDLAALRDWNEFKVFKDRSEGYFHLVWGRISILIENGELECIPTCAECGSEEIGEISSGDEGWTVCLSCRSVEQGYTYISRRAFDRR